MASQTDLDQGGTFRQYVKRWLGPSVGWINSPDTNVLPVTAAGTVTPVINTTLVTVNVAGLVTVQLWDPIAPPDVPAGVMPGDYLALPFTVVDIGGYAFDYNVTILPAAGRTIIGLAQIQITEAYGAWTLLPNLDTGNWNIST